MACLLLISLLRERKISTKAMKAGTGRRKELEKENWLCTWCMDYGIVDEMRVLEVENRNPILVDTKTRGSDSLPSEPQRRNGRLQLMCYKLLWDSLVAQKFPSKGFFDFFSLNPNHILSEDIRTSSAAAIVPAQTLDEVVRYLGNTCSMLLPANNHMILRYEWQKDDSLLVEV